MNGTRERVSAARVVARGAAFAGDLWRERTQLASLRVLDSDSYHVMCSLQISSLCRISQRETSETYSICRRCQSLGEVSNNDNLFMLLVRALGDILLCSYILQRMSCLVT